MLDIEDLTALMHSWLIHLAAQHKSPETIKSYRKGVRQFLDWSQRHGVKPALDTDTVSAFVADLLDDGKAPSTARLRQLAVRRFSAWLADEDEIDRDLLIGVKPPKLDVKVVDELDEDELRALIKACSGKTLACKRDEAIVRLMSETGARAGEIVNMHTGDVDVIRGLAVIRRGKGAKGRHIPFGPATGAAIDRYLRARRRHRHADGPRLWLGEQSRGFTYDALYKSLKTRARAAGIDRFHPHQLRHTWASRWLAAGGSEQGAMAVGGWSRRDMLDRYTQATTEKRAADEARRLGLGDL
ncbi:MAG TPA: tyrosine-type recombinase/integrase [Euzebyales bacterium]|nr:tyrosine-type recombinase/integrase [Euzebyales bacterium]